VGVPPPEHCGLLKIGQNNGKTLAPLDRRLTELTEFWVANAHPEPKWLGRAASLIGGA